MDGGYTLHTCSCGYSYKTDHTEARGHYYATSNSTCTRCGSAQHTHSYTSTVVAPTCTEGGYTLHTCQCGNSYKDTETAARGHFYATSTSPCSRCGHVQGEASGSSSSTIIKEYSYIYSGDTLVEMDVRTIVDNGTPVPDLLTFTYDANGYPATVTSNGVTYYYVTNLQGDVVAILDAGRSIVVQYTYDAWGQVLSTTGSLAATLGETNPLRYRGYVYDGESGLYYLQSRYYDPQVGRFLNADAFTSTGPGMLGNNMFAYCANNPAAFVDITGTAAYLCTSRLNDVGEKRETEEPDPNSNFSNFNSDDLFFENKTVHYDISKLEATRVYDTIKAGDYGQMLGVNPVPSLLGMSDKYGDMLSLLYDILEGTADAYNHDTLDPEGRLLYIEEGYNIITLHRIFIGDSYSATETEYFIYDNKWDLMFNDVISDTYITD